MHAFRAFLLVVVILVGASEGLFVKKLLLKKAAAVKVGFLADVKAAALKFKAGAALKKDAILGGFKAIGKAKLGIIGGIKAAKLKVLGGIAAAKLAKLAAIKAGKLAFVKTLAAVKLAPLVAKKLAAGAVIGKGAAIGGGLLKKGELPIPKKESGNPILDGVTGLIGAASPFLGGGNGANPLGSLGSLVLGGITSAQENNQKLDLASLLGNVGGLSALIPQPGKPNINIQTYQVNPPIQSYVQHAPLPPVTSYGVPVPYYGPPATSYGVPQY
ncbi:uncharacterized protein LOC125500287 [Athalia rosae]|uniref:uncharacterized protein LOC125500287 n=1 Tax=Athalia rosae TaxID=37344 RepID=UPI002033D17D|nr:uncharacterized protein LOC125500287 [Athalia rosae]